MSWISSFFRNAFPVACVMALGIASSPAWAQFGSPGINGRSGTDGQRGHSGSSIVVRADGTPASYDISGHDASNGSSGEPGYSASGCFQGTPSMNLTGASGGNGGSGGDGGVGGDGGAVTAYFTDINALKQIAIRGAPGRAGVPGWGGRGGEPCRCQQYSWQVDVGGAPQTFFCTDGQRGFDAGGGAQGSNGSYGSITLISQMDPLGPEVPSANVDMSRMEASHIALSQNHWEAHTGARSLFQPGSEISDRYSLFVDRTEIDYSFSWQASRPVSDFAGWGMLVRIEGDDARLYLPDSLWFDGETLKNGNQRTFVFRGAVSTGELGNLQFEDFSGSGLDHVVAVKDNSGVSAIVITTVHLTYYSVESGSYHKRYDADVPADALVANANGFQITMGKLGIDAAQMALGTQAYVGLTVTRALGTHSAAYTMATYYTITWTPRVGDLVQAKVDADLYSGATVVGHVAHGDQFNVAAVQGDWISLKKLDGTAVRGWIKVSDLEAGSP